jgi:hypothetical protein
MVVIHTQDGTMDASLTSPKHDHDVIFSRHSFYKRNRTLSFPFFPAQANSMDRPKFRQNVTQPKKRISCIDKIDTALTKLKMLFMDSDGRNSAAGPNALNCETDALFIIFSGLTLKMVRELSVLKKKYMYSAIIISKRY